MFDLIKKSYKETKDAQYQKVSGGHCQSRVGPPTFCTLAALCCEQSQSHKVIRVSRRNDAWTTREFITKACAVNHSHKHRSGGLMRHRLRIAAALDKIILMIFDELMVGRSGGVGWFGVRLPRHPRVGPDAGASP